jgi:hypothetical protein
MCHFFQIYAFSYVDSYGVRVIFQINTSLYIDILSFLLIPPYMLLRMVYMSFFRLTPPLRVMILY